MLFPTLRKNKKSPPLKKNKTLPTHNPTDRKGMKEIVDKQKGMSLDKKERPACNMRYILLPS